MKRDGTFIIIIVSIILCSCLLVSFMACRIISQTLYSALEGKGIVISRIMAHEITHDMGSNNISHIQQFLQEMVRTIKLIEYAYITRLEEEICAHSFQEGFPQKAMEEIQKNNSSTSPRSIMYSTFKGPILETVYHLANNGISFDLHVGLNAGDTQKQVITMRKKILSLAAIIMLVGIFVCSIIYYYFLQTSEHKGREECRDFQYELVTHHEEKSPDAGKDRIEFLSNISHKIFTPLNGIIGMIGILLESDLTLDQYEFAEIIKNSADLLLTVINDILDLSVMEAGKMDLEELDFDLRITLEDLNTILSARAHDKGIALDCLVEAEVPSLLTGDPGRLRQILINLMGNAIKFTEKGRVSLNVALDYEDDTHVIIRFVIKDTGGGIPEETTKTIFDNAHQAHDSHFCQIGSSGLGLSICKRLTEIMGGKIGVESGVGKGSTFWFTVSLKKQSYPSETLRGFSDNNEDLLKDTRIIAVDDNETNRLVLAQILDRFGCRHEEAPNARSCLRRLREATSEGDPFNIALLDMQMPDMDGESLGAFIKKEPTLKDIILVMMTSIGKRGDAARLKKIGFAAYFTKPVKQSLLHDCLLTIIEENEKGISMHDRIITRYTLAEDRKHKIRILLIEENMSQQQSILKILTNLGYRANAVSSLREAKVELETVPYTMVLMGIQESEINSESLSQNIHAIKSNAHNRDMPVIIISGTSMQDNKDSSLKTVFDDYIITPLQPDHFALVIERWI